MSANGTKIETDRDTYTFQAHGLLPGTEKKARPAGFIFLLVFLLINQFFINACPPSLGIAWLLWQSPTSSGVRGRRCRSGCSVGACVVSSHGFLLFADQEEYAQGGHESERHEQDGVGALALVVHVPVGRGFVFAVVSEDVGEGGGPTVSRPLLMSKLSNVKISALLYLPGVLVVLVMFWRTMRVTEVSSSLPAL